MGNVGHFTKLSIFIIWKIFTPVSRLGKDILHPVVSRDSDEPDSINPSSDTRENRSKTQVYDSVKYYLNSVKSFLVVFF